MMQTCPITGDTFVVADEDLEFYEKVSPMIGGNRFVIPPPRLCPKERVRRRMAWRNDRSFHKRKCDKTGQDIIALYPANAPFPVYHTDAWWGDGWDPTDYGMEYDFNRPFFDQFADLMNKVPRRNMDHVNCENSQYCNYCGDDKNCYLDIAGEGNENCYYDLYTKYSTDCVDCTFVYRSTLCYESIQCYDCYNVLYSMYMDNSNDCAFCFDCKGCKNCLLSVNQRNKQYMILNQQHTKEEYIAKLKELNLESYESVQKVKALWEQMRIEKGIYRDMYVINCENCFGNNVKSSKNCDSVFNIGDCEDCKFLYDVLEAKDCQDLNYSLYHPEVAYELISTLQMRYSAFCMATHFSNNCYYCDLSDNSSNLFGCIGLNHKEYCVLNRQYSKEEYEKILPKIIEHMRTTKEWGEFFPIEISPWGYNETVAQEYMPLAKEEITSKGWKWMEKPEDAAAPAGSGIQPPDHIDEVQDTLTDQQIICKNSRRAFKIIPQELKFYRQVGIPIPHRCPDERHRDRMTLRNPRTLWSRVCAKCNNPIRTSYKEGRPEKVYCERCYLETVY